MQLPIAQPDEESNLDQGRSAPFSAPEDVKEIINDDNQMADSDVDAQEWYDEGLSGVVENQKSSNARDYRYQSEAEWNSKHGPVMIAQPSSERSSPG